MSSPGGPLSPDGSHWWDGQAWRPVESPPPDPVPAPISPPRGPITPPTLELPREDSEPEPTLELPREHSAPEPEPASPARPRGVLITGAIAGVVLIGAVAVGVVATRGGWIMPAPTPTAASQHQLAQRYEAVVRPDMQTLVSAVNDVRSRCGGFDAIGCRQALRNMQVLVQAFQKDLDGLRVPDCHKDTDRELRVGLDLYNRGDASAITGIDTSNTVLYAQGGTLLDEGSSHMNKANTMLAGAGCP